MKPEIKLSYQIEGGVDPKEVADVFRRSGIQRPVNDIDQIWRMIRHTDLVICAREHGRIVGVARALTDFSYCCYLSEVAVDRGYQRSGIGKKLIHSIQERVGWSWLVCCRLPKPYRIIPIPDLRKPNMPG